MNRLRRRLIAASGALLAAPHVLGEGSSGMPRVGYLFSFVRAQGEHLWEACRRGLREIGYEEGRNIVLEPRWAAGQSEQLRELVADLVRLKVDVIVSAATPASLAAKAGAGAIPIVIVAVADPVKVGLVASLARPGGNVTGLTLLTPELSGKRLQLLVDLAGRPGRVALLTNPDNRSHEIFRDETAIAASALGIQLHSIDARNASEIARAFEFSESGRPDGLIVFDDPVLWSHRQQVVELASNARLPVVYGYSEFADVGGLLTYGPHRGDLYRRTAGYVDRILRGARPAELPIERPTRFELVVNLKAAQALALRIPDSVLLRADRVIE